MRKHFSCVLSTVGPPSRLARNAARQHGAVGHTKCNVDFSMDTFFVVGAMRLRELVSGKNSNTIAVTGDRRLKLSSNNKAMSGGDIRAG
jgi:hypothetical protein